MVLHLLASDASGDFVITERDKPGVPQMILALLRQTIWAAPMVVGAVGALIQPGHPQRTRWRVYRSSGYGLLQSAWWLVR